jgi:hypothetical protein
LDTLLDGAPPGGSVPVAGRAGVSVEALLDEEGHARTARADNEIIERAVLLGQLAGAPATLVTADTRMRLRAQCAGTTSAALRAPGRSGGSDRVRKCSFVLDGSRLEHVVFGGRVQFGGAFHRAEKHARSAGRLQSHLAWTARSPRSRSRRSDA